METADAGIAVPEASDVAKEAGDVIIAKNDIMLVLSSIELSRQTIRKVKQNIFWAIGYNSALIPIAGGALVPLFGLQVYSVLPILSALAMGMSSTSVVLNSLLLQFFYEQCRLRPHNIPETDVTNVFAIQKYFNS